MGKSIEEYNLIQIIIEVQEGEQADATVDAISNVESIMNFDFARFEVKGIQTYIDETKLRNNDSTW